MDITNAVSMTGAPKPTGISVLPKAITITSAHISSPAAATTVNGAGAFPVLVRIMQNNDTRHLEKNITKKAQEAEGAISRVWI